MLPEGPRYGAACAVGTRRCVNGRGGRWTQASRVRRPLASAQVARRDRSRPGNAMINFHGTRSRAAHIVAAWSWAPEEMPCLVKLTFIVRVLHSSWP